MTDPRLELRSAPHLHAPHSVEQIMRNVVLALLPVAAFGIWLFGISAAALIAVVTASCLATEQLFTRFAGRASTLGDGSAAITGLLLAFTLPPAFPLWMGAVSGFVAIALGKALFGGLGHNVFNPALVGRAFAQAAFPAATTTWTAPLLDNRYTHFLPGSLAPPLMTPVIPDAVSGATPLGIFKSGVTSYDAIDLFVGTTSGTIGETSAVLILLCGAYLAVRRMLDWRIPAAILLTTALLSGALHLVDAGRYPNPYFMLFSGGLMLGAVFMATDMVGTPVTPLGVWIYGALIGALTVVIRLFGSQSEGVMYAILLGNAATPLIESVTQPRTYGRRGRRGRRNGP